MHFSLLSKRHPRNPLARALSLLIGLAVIGVLLVFGLFVAGVLLVGGVVLLAIRQWKQGNAPVSTQRTTSRTPEVLEGDFVVVRRDRPVTH
jgi:hypothetical protein